MGKLGLRINFMIFPLVFGLPLGSRLSKTIFSLELRLQVIIAIEVHLAIKQASRGCLLVCMGAVMGALLITSMRVFLHVRVHAKGIVALALELGAVAPWSTLARLHATELGKQLTRTVQILLAIDHVRSWRCGWRWRRGI